MPELPEVETVVRGLRPVMEGERFAKVEQRRSDLRFPLPARFAARLKGRRIEQLSRRAKYILAHLDRREVLAIHLGMSGRITVGGQGRIGGFTHDTGGDPVHDHVVFHLSGGATITFNDARRFGYMELIGAAELSEHKLFRNLGVEPLSNDLSPQRIAELADGRQTELKSFLADQRQIAGLGNIYICEALWLAGLSPLRKTHTLGQGEKRAAALHAAIRSVLEDAIAAGGSSLRDYRQASGELGSFQKSHAVYDREGEPCQRQGCRGTVARHVQGGRSTFWCPKCQR